MAERKSLSCDAPTRPWLKRAEEERHTPDGDQNRHDVGEVKLNDHVGAILAVRQI